MEQGITNVAVIDKTIGIHQVKRLQRFLSNKRMSHLPKKNGNADKFVTFSLFCLFCYSITIYDPRKGKVKSQKYIYFCREM